MLLSFAVIDVFSCALSWILLIAEIQKDGSWKLSLAIYLQCQAVVKSLSHLVLFWFFFPCLEGYKSAQTPERFQIGFCNILQPCFIPSFVKKCTDAKCVQCCQHFWSPWGCEPWTLWWLTWCGSAAALRGGQRFSWLPALWTPLGCCAASGTHCHGHLLLAWALDLLQVFWDMNWKILALLSESRVLEACWRRTLLNLIFKAMGLKSKCTLLSIWGLFFHIWEAFDLSVY